MWRELFEGTPKFFRHKYSPPFNARLLKTFKNYSGTRADKITWIGTGWCKLVRKDDSYGKYPDKTKGSLKN